MARLDPHSYADADQPQADFLEWHARVETHSRVLECEAILHFAEPASGPLDLDTRDLTIYDVSTVPGGPVPFEHARAEPVLGSRLRIVLPAGSRSVRIRYDTSPRSSALQWLEPRQTASGTDLFLYSQCQAIHARAVVPLQDTPRTRLRYRAQLTVPKGLTALMAAAHVGHEEHAWTVVESFEMPQPIAPYLFALAVGKLASRDVSPRCRVWAEPSVVESAAWEFADAERMLATGEALFGPYDWERFDLLVLPPAFPYGGMENPRLTFLTPTLLAGDRSLASVVAHELAHSWTGNLVSNASAEHFWLNEGFTTYAERRIIEALYGPERAALEWALGRRELDRTLRQLARDGHPEWTRLRTHLAGVDPDDAYSLVPYEKGALLLAALEQALGRAAWDTVLRAYIARFRFQALTTEDFTAFVERAAPGALAAINATAWLTSPGLPETAPRFESRRLGELAVLGDRVPDPARAAAWGPLEWQIYLEALPHPAPLEFMTRLDQQFRLTQSQNYDVLEKWLTLAAQSRYTPAQARIEEVLARVGRMKYLKPLYRALAERPETAGLARRLFVRNASRYHPIARQSLGGLLGG